MLHVPAIGLVQPELGNVGGLRKLYLSENQLSGEYASGKKNASSLNSVETIRYVPPTRVGGIHRCRSFYENLQKNPSNRLGPKLTPFLHLTCQLVLADVKRNQVTEAPQCCWNWPCENCQNRQISIEQTVDKNPTRACAEHSHTCVIWNSLGNVLSKSDKSIACSRHRAYPAGAGQSRRPMNTQTSRLTS